MRTWKYNKDGGRLFEDGETIPAGYVDSPADVKEDKPAIKKAEPKPAEKKPAIKKTIEKKKD
tara:strand:+ start:3089 stop:3274 length:186 start_codon:yes stop_codon:yes gene_type:complete